MDEEEAQEAENATDQLIHVSGRVPTRARTLLAMMSFTSPTVRQDSEAADRAKWLGLIASLLTSTPTPLGERL